MKYDADAIVIGAGGGGPVVAKELGEKGIKVIVLEAGPWYGNKQWPYPNSEKGASGSSDPGDLSVELLHSTFTDYEMEMNSTITGKLRWGPADLNRPPWFRMLPRGGFAWQNAGAGGTTMTYFAISPRAYPAAVDNVWPISYQEMVPYYQKVEATLPVAPAPMTEKEELFFYGARKAGWSLLKTLNVTSPGYRPSPNAILPPSPDINQPGFEFDSKQPGCTLRGHCINGCHIGPTVDTVAKRSTLVSYIPLALNTGFVEVRPNTYVVKILTETQSDGLKAIGIRYRDTWKGETGELRAKVVVLAAGCIESPRLWLNSQLPDNPWVGKGMTTHYFDCISGVFSEQVLRDALGVSEVRPYVGQTAAARFDYPGLGSLMTMGVSPGLTSALLFTFGSKYNVLNQHDPAQPWDARGRVVGPELKEFMQEYPRTLSMLVLTDDEVNQRNGVSLHSLIKDEHGPVPVIQYYPGKQDQQKRDKLANIAGEILKKAGAKQVLRADCSPYLLAHIESTMRMGYVVDTNCEALQAKGLFVADNSVHYNSIGGVNPTLTTQALATRTAEKIFTKYFA